MYTKPPVPAAASGQKFEIRGFDVGGATLLPSAQIERLLQPYVGCNKGFGDVQKVRLDGAWTNKPNHINPTDTPATLPGVTCNFRMHGALVYLF